MKISLTTPPHQILAAHYRGDISERSLNHDRHRATDPGQITAIERAQAIIDATLTLPSEDPDDLAHLFQSGKMTRRQLEAACRTTRQQEAVEALFTLRPVTQ